MMMMMINLEGGGGTRDIGSIHYITHTSHRIHMCRIMAFCVGFANQLSPLSMRTLKLIIIFVAVLTYHVCLTLDDLFRATLITILTTLKNGRTAPKRFWGIKKVSWTEDQEVGFSLCNTQRQTGLFFFGSEWCQIHICSQTAQDAFLGVYYACCVNTRASNLPCEWDKI